MPKPIESFPQASPLDEHNRLLISNVHPPEWLNPEPKGRYHIVVIGAGTAGLVTAIGAAGLGARVAILERSLMGGDCLNTGCVPSKALIRAAHAAASVREADEFGIHIPEDAVLFDFGKMMERMRRLRAGISEHDSAQRFSDLGIDVFLGNAKFTGHNTVEIADKSLKFSKACIATGTRAALPPIEGLAEAGALTNETIFSLTELPPRMAVIGAGPIGVEMSQSFARFGSTVTLIDHHDGILFREDRDAAALVEKSLLRDGISVAFGSKVNRIRVEDNTKILEIELVVDGTLTSLRVDQVLVAAGRTPNVEQLGLEAAGVTYDTRRGVTVNAKLRTSNRHIYAAGDICSNYKFTHTADAMARIVIGNALFFGRSKVSSLVIPWCTYSDPELAHVGIHEHEAEQKNIRIDTYVTELKSVDRAVLDSEQEGFVKIHCAQGTDKILGATIVAKHAGDMISQVTTAIQGALGLKSIASTIHPYPTQAEAIRKTADAYQRTRLTPTVKKLLGAILRWRR